MPDLQTELAKVNQAIKEWDEHPTREYNFKPTNNVTRATFVCVRDNPGRSRTAIADLLEAKGYKRTSVSALLRHMLLQGLIREDGNGLFATQAEYTPIKTSLLKQAREKHAKKKPGRKGSNPAAAPTAVAAIAPMPPGLRFKATAAELLDTLSITQARELYDELRKIFGG